MITVPNQEPTTTKDESSRLDLIGLYAGAAWCAVLGPTLLTYNDKGPGALLGVMFVGAGMVAAANIAYQEVTRGFKRYKESRNIDATIEKLTDRITNEQLSNGERLSDFTKLSTAVATHFETKSPALRQETAQGMAVLGKYLADSMPDHLQSRASDVINLAMSGVNWKLGIPDTTITKTNPGIAAPDATNTNTTFNM